jgi:transmembrane mucin 1
MRIGESNSSRASFRSRLSQQPLLTEEMNQVQSPRPISDPDWSDLRRRVNQLELQGVHGYSGSPSLRPGRSPPQPPPRPSSAPTQHPDADDGNYGARPRVTSFYSHRGEDAFHGWDQPPGLGNSIFAPPPQVEPRETIAHIAPADSKLKIDDPGWGQQEVPLHANDTAAPSCSSESSSFGFGPGTSHSNFFQSHPATEAAGHLPTLPASLQPTFASSFQPTLPASLQPTFASSFQPTLPASHPATVSSSQPATPSASHPATFPASFQPTLPASHPATVSSSHTATLPASFQPTLPTSHPATFSASHPAAVSSSHPATLPASFQPTLPSLLQVP